MLRVKLIDRFIIRQYLSTFFFILGAVLVLCLLIDFVEKLDEFIEKDPPMQEILFEYYINFIFYWGNLLAPVCICLAVTFFTSRMAGRSELVPLLSCGVSFYRLLVPYLIVSFFLAGISFVLKSYIIPDSTAERVEFEYKYLRKRRISNNKDVHKKVAQDTYVYMSYYNERNMEGHTFGLERIVDGKIVTKISARKIEWIDSLQVWRMKRVQVREIGEKRERLYFYPEKDTTFLLTPDDIFIKEQKQETMRLPDLLEYIRLEEMRGSDILEELYIERHRRFADPIAGIILTLIGFAMSSRKARGGVALQIGLGLLMCFTYIALLFVGQAMVSDTFPAWAAVWMPNMLYLPIALILLRLVPK
ncbi:MAG: LptF/LptG family permease [Bacteroidia bacterium]